MEKIIINLEEQLQETQKIMNNLHCINTMLDAKTRKLETDINEIHSRVNKVIMMNSIAIIILNIAFIISCFARYLK